MSASSAVHGSTLGLTPVTSDLEELHLEGKVQSGVQGIAIRRLLLSVPGAAADATLEELRPLSTCLERLEVAIDMELLLASIVDLQELRCTSEGQHLVIEARRMDCLFLARTQFLPGSFGSRGNERTLLVDLGIPTRLGNGRALDEDILAALERGLSLSSGGIARCVPYAVLVDPITSILRTIFSTKWLEDSSSRKPTSPSEYLWLREPTSVAEF